jgi:hypothetical protein
MATVMMHGLLMAMWLVLELSNGRLPGVILDYAARLDLSLTE